MSNTRDQAGTAFVAPPAPFNQPVPTGTPIQIVTPNGLVAGVMVGNEAVKN